jgi:hypothetical protein
LYISTKDTLTVYLKLDDGDIDDDAALLSRELLDGVGVGVGTCDSLERGRSLEPFDSEVADEDTEDVGDAGRCSKVGAAAVGVGGGKKEGGRSYDWCCSASNKSAIARGTIPSSDSSNLPLC